MDTSARAALVLALALIVPAGVAQPAAPPDVQPAAPPAADPPGAAVAPPRPDDPGFDAYEHGDLAQAVAAFGALAARGDPIAQYNLAVIRLREESMSIPLDTALRYLRDSAQHGFARSQHLLGTLHENGRYLPRSQPMALHWFLKAAEQGLTDAQLSAGTQFYLGRGTRRDYVQAAHWYERAAEGGDVAAQYLIASMYEQGLGVTRDLRTALVWYTAAARQGDPVARMKARAIAEEIAREPRP